MTNEIMETETDRTAVIRPDVDGAGETMRLFQQLKRRVLDPEDTVKIQGKDYIKRSGWRKIALAFRVSTEILEERFDEPTSTWHVKARAYVGSRHADEVGSCDMTGDLHGISSSAHNARAKAATRAINRAISDLVGGGELSAEEMEGAAQQADTTQQGVPASQSKITEKQLDLVNRITKNDPKAMDYIAYFIEKRHVQDLAQLDKVQGSELIDAITDYKNGKKVAPSYRTDEEFQAWLRAQAEAPA